MEVTTMPNLNLPIKVGLIRELNRLGLITKDQFAKLMEQQRGQ